MANVFGTEALSLRQFKERMSADKVFFIKSVSHFRDEKGNVVHRNNTFKDAEGKDTGIQKVKIADTSSNQPLANVSRRICQEMSEGKAFLSSPVVFKEVTSSYPGKGAMEGQTVTKTEWYAMRPQEVEVVGKEVL